MNSMRHFILVWLWLSVGMVNGFSQKSWKKYVDPKKAFEIMSPGPLTFEEKNIESAIGTVKVVTYVHSGIEPDPNTAYMIQYFDYPSGTFHPDSLAAIQDLFDATIEQNMTGLQGLLVYKTDIKMGDYPGILFRGSYQNEKSIIKSKMFLVGDRLYILQVFTPSAKSLNPSLDAFMESFKLNQIP